MSDKRDEALRLLEQMRERLQRDLERLAARHNSGRRSDTPYAAELEYHLSQLSDALNAFHHLAFRSMHRHEPRPELLAHVDTLLKHTDEIREIARRAREVLLRPPPEEQEPGFTE